MLNICRGFCAATFKKINKQNLEKQSVFDFFFKKDYFF